MGEKENNEYEVVSGDGSTLDISPVFEHLSAGKPKCNDDNLKNIVIPKTTKTKDKKDEDESDEENEDKDSE